MSSRLPAWSRVAMAVLVPLWLLAVPSIASAQHGGGGHGGGGGGGHASSGGGGGGHASSGGGGGHASGGGGHASGSGGGHVSGGSSAGSHTASHGAQPGPSSGTSSTGTTGTAVQRGSDGSASPGVPPYSRPRNGAPTVGTATPRVGPPPLHGGGGGVYVPYYGGYYPWGLVGLGLYGGYYGGIYDPWYDPWGYGGGYGGGYYPPETYGYDEEGALHLKVKPKQAQVYVDGYYAGVVDDFDGVFQKLHVEAGPHRLEFRAEGYETLSVDVNVEPGQTITYKGELKKIQ